MSRWTRGEADQCFREARVGVGLDEPGLFINPGECENVDTLTERPVHVRGGRRGAGGCDWPRGCGRVYAVGPRRDVVRGGSFVEPAASWAAGKGWACVDCVRRAGPLPPGRRPFS